ncbi:hypothetical protein B4N89_44980 [Embleya scabrispora]|uniref:Uncharacterized protein n=1 Tax=Embleya scabrispora TaxID=159449 RepID=A0A1T3NIN1_9ACTN|nr:hypothetical protein [Embleya scabrispora]OPC76648.1 hypothetical protein B4N89_44980 [Embleya scabrispora]
MTNESDLELFLEDLRRFLDEARAFQIMDDNLARLRLHDPDTALLTVGFLDAHCDPRLSDEQAAGHEAYVNAKHAQGRLDLWTSLFEGTVESGVDTE